MKLPLPTKKAHIKRLKEWEIWLETFNLQNGRKIKYIPNAAWLLNDLYWRIAEQFLRPILKTSPEKDVEHRIHPYKIISASEITIMMVEPIIDQGEKSKENNALLAWFIATSIIEGWKTGEPEPITKASIDLIAGYKENIDHSHKYPESYAAEHVKWLSQLNVAIEKPFLLNAQCWRLFYLACLTVAKNSKTEK